MSGTPQMSWVWKKLKESATNYRMHPLLLKQVLKFSGDSKIVLSPKTVKVWRAMLEPGPQLQWCSLWRVEAKDIEQRNRARGINVSQDQLLGEGTYAVVHIVIYRKQPWHTAALSAWDRVRKQEKDLNCLLRLGKVQEKYSLTFYEDWLQLQIERDHIHKQGKYWLNL